MQEQKQEFSAVIVDKKIVAVDIRVPITVCVDLIGHPNKDSAANQLIRNAAMNALRELIAQTIAVAAGQLLFDDVIGVDDKPIVTVDQEKGIMEIDFFNGEKPKTPELEIAPLRLELSSNKDKVEPIPVVEPVVQPTPGVSPVEANGAVVPQN